MGSVIIDYKSEDYVEVINRETSGNGVEFVFDTICGDTIEKSSLVLCEFGRLATIVDVAQPQSLLAHWGKNTEGAGVEAIRTATGTAADAVARAAVAEIGIAPLARITVVVTDGGAALTTSETCCSTRKMKISHPSPVSHC